MSRESFIFYVKWANAIKDCTAEIKAEVYDAIIRYACTDEVSELSPLAQMAFNFIKPELDKVREAYDAVCEKNRINGAKGGRPKKVQETQENPKNPLGFSETQQNPTKPNETQPNPKNLDNDNDNDILSSLHYDNIINASLFNNNDVSEIPSDVESEIKVNWQQLVTYFNETTKGAFGKIRMPLSEVRRKHITARIRQYGKEAFVEVINKMNSYDWMKGQSWATFDWMILPTNFEKVLSGNYDNRQTATQEPNDTRHIGKKDYGEIRL